MRVRPVVIAASMVLAVLGAVFVATPPAQGDPKSDQALAAAVKRGKELWSKPWSAGAKTCAECHAGGANKMSAVRLRTYPKFDKAADRVITGQQKLNHMIHEKGKGEFLELGSDDLNALEAFVATLK